MSRPIQYDLDAVTDKALAVFWRQGFTGSSVDQLIDATGLNKHSLYKTFNGKNGLFRRCLQRYIDTEAQPFLALLENNSGLTALSCYFDALCKPAKSAGGYGCLIANTAIELGADHAVSSTVVKRYYRQLATLLSRAIEQGQATDEISKDIDAAAIAAWLVHMVQGLAISHRCHTPLPHSADTLLSLITAATSPAFDNTH